MCHQITYTLPCEHIRTDIVYCADAPAPQTAKKSSSSSKGSSGGGSSSKKDGGRKHRDHSSREKGRDRDGRSSPRREPCRQLTSQAIAYPLPPSFAGDPSTAAASPLLPKCPLPRCPFEARNRCWNCCWCGKGWNEQGRCSCIMIIDGNQVRCEHICCETCTPAMMM